MISNFFHKAFGFDPRWRPIETAPKDGTSVFVCEPGGGMGLVHFAHWCKTPVWANSDGSTVHPTHWMECPDWPKEIKVERLRESIDGGVPRIMGALNEAADERDELRSEVERLRADLSITVSALKKMAGGHMFPDPDSADRWMRGVAGSALEEIGASDE
jgi:hypothetical protein